MAVLVRTLHAFYEKPSVIALILSEKPSGMKITSRSLDVLIVISVDEKMPVKISWEIIPGRDKYDRAQLIMNEYYFGEELSLRPRMVFEKSYRLPGQIYCGRNPKLQYKNSNDYCHVLYTIKIRKNVYIDRPLTNKSTTEFINFNCRGRCVGCCAYLPQQDTYEKFEKVFREIANDINKAWDDAVAKARNFKAFEKGPVIISSSDYNRSKRKMITCGYIKKCR